MVVLRCRWDERMEMSSLWASRPRSKGSQAESTEAVPTMRGERGAWPAGKGRAQGQRQMGEEEPDPNMATECHLGQTLPENIHVCL